MPRDPRSPRLRRHLRIRARVHGTAARPRLAVFRSLKHFTAQLIDDEARRTLVAASDRTVKATGTKTERAIAVGKNLAEQAKALKITTVVFDRSGWRFHGRVKAFADAARENGLIF